MAVDVRKYNPGFLTDDEIVASFCVRTGELESLLESLRGNTGNSNVHSLVIGPRGSGKTHLLLRVAAEIRRDPSLAGFLPIVFAEESYEVSTAGEFWLECLGRLVDQAPEAERADLRLSYNDLRTEDRDRDLATRCLGAILGFAGRQDKRLVLIVENLNTLFSDMVDPDAGWRLRHTLQNEPGLSCWAAPPAGLRKSTVPIMPCTTSFGCLPCVLSIPTHAPSSGRRFPGSPPIRGE